MEKKELKAVKEWGISEQLVDYAIIERYLRFLTWSGRYEYSSGKFSYQTAADLYKRITDLKLTLANPSYQLKHPLFRKAETTEIIKKTFTTIKLHIDIDSTDPLNVVSGTVRKWPRFVLSPTAIHFMGQVTSNTVVTGGRELIVENFNFNWPQASKEVDRLEITLSNIANPVAKATFICTADSTTFGPFHIPRKSKYFREVEMEIDREDDARTVEPYNTHTHPERPTGLRSQNLTIRKAYARAGVKVEYSDEDNIISTAGAGEGGWTNAELHQAMEDHWSDFANKPQWKLWVFLGEHHANDSYAGIMFDSETTLPGDVTRQGTAVFTESDWLFGATGDFASDNTSPDEAVERELFFTTVHEIGHAFNLAHSWQKTLGAPYGSPWTPPDWAPAMVDNDQGLSWMNYPWRADEDPVDTYCAKWFYDRFTFRFQDSENFFLRHAPEEFVQMGNETWFENHGLADESRVNRALALKMTSRREALEYGEPVFIELRLRNVSDKTIYTHGILDPASGFVQIAITDPDGVKLPFLAPIHIDQCCEPKEIEPGSSIYESVQLTVGKMGFYFKKPGPYRIEACFINYDGSQSSAVTQVWVRPASFDDERALSTLYDGRVARVLYFGGARKMEDVNEKLEWVLKKLSPKHPARAYLANCIAMPLTMNWKTLPRGAQKVSVVKADHSKVERVLAPLMDNLGLLVDSLGHIKAREVTDSYVHSAVKARKKAKALEVKKEALEIFKKRKVVDSVLMQLEDDIKRLK
jgi:hypothetical protein